jgi:hypothetical protein
LGLGAFEIIVGGAAVVIVLVTSLVWLPVVEDETLAHISPAPKVFQALDAGHLNRAEAAKKLRVRKAALIEALASFPKGGGDAEPVGELAGVP